MICEFTDFNGPVLGTTARLVGDIVYGNVTAVDGQQYAFSLPYGSYSHIETGSGLSFLATCREDTVDANIIGLGMVAFASAMRITYELHRAYQNRDEIVAAALSIPHKVLNLSCSLYNSLPEISVNLPFLREAPQSSPSFRA